MRLHNRKQYGILQLASIGETSVGVNVYMYYFMCIFVCTTFIDVIYHFERYKVITLHSIIDQVYLWYEGEDYSTTGCTRSQ